MNTVQALIAPSVNSNAKWIEGGKFYMGSDQHYPEEAPQRETSVDGFWMESGAVTNLDFKKFVEATGYVSLAERSLSLREASGLPDRMRDAGSFVFTGAKKGVSIDDPTLWWAFVKGADWCHPEGPNSNIDGRENEPVVHISFKDALDYVRWKGADLPTESEWEYAALGGKSGLDEWPWGNELTPNNVAMANTWHGEFPSNNTGCAGYKGRAPSRSFPENEFGLFNMIGNVWEWTKDRYQIENIKDKYCCSVNVQGTISATSVIPEMVIKGGSYLCSPSYCRRYRASARISLQVNTATGHIGFRCVYRPK